MAIDWKAFSASWHRAEEARRNEYQLVFKHPKDGSEIWKSNPGPQSYTMWRPEFEILAGGARGGGKSQLLMVWMIRGNFDLAPEHPCYSTVLNHPKFSGLILRRDATDLEEFIATARPFYKELGGELTGNPAMFKWKHGPYIRLSHLKSAEGFEKYRGNSIPRIGIEELTQLEEKRAYMLLLSCCRTAHPELRPAWSDALGQVLSTTNPDGPGQWVKDRFAEVPDREGKPVPWGKTICETIEGQRLTRIFIPSRLKDNPHLGDSYKAGLMLQAEDDPATVAAWIHGIWGQTSNTYFGSFRPMGPREGEPPEANHIVPEGKVNLMAWWPRFIGCDWGFSDEAAVEWGCFNHADGRTHIYREFVVSGMGSEELGAEIARRSLDDLAGLENHTIPMWLSHECFNKVDTGRTRADQIAAGIQRVLGPNSVVVAQHGEAVDNWDYGAVDGRMKILLYPSTRLREDVWQYMRGLLRFRPIVREREPNMQYASALLNGPDGFDRYERYMKSFADQKPEVLPGLLIWDGCKRLIKQVRDAQKDPKKPEDILETRNGNEHWDALNAGRYLLHGMKVVAEKLPRYAFLAQRLEAVPDAVRSDPTRMAQVLRKAEWDYQRRQPSLKPLSLPRASSMRVQ